MVFILAASKALINFLAVNDSIDSKSAPQQELPKQQLQHAMQAHDFLIIGHRGAAGIAPENTLQSFNAALQWQCPMIELDVYACYGEQQQRELVVIHDDKLNRTTNGRGRVMEHTVAQLRTLDAGMGQVIPLLGEVVELIQRHNTATGSLTALNIELKGPGTAAPTANFVSQSAEVPVLVSSFNHDELRNFHQLLPNHPVAPLYDRYRDDWPTTAEGLHATAINLSRRIATPARISAMRQAGYMVFVYTVNTVEEAQKLQAAGANGVFTDRPDLLIPGLG